MEYFVILNAPLGFQKPFVLTSLQALLDSKSPELAGFWVDIGFWVDSGVRGV